MDNPTFVDEETIRMVHQDDDEYYDDYNTPNTSRVDEASFTEPDTAEATSAWRLRQKLKRDKISALYKHSNVTADPGLADIGSIYDQKKFQKQATLTCFFSVVINIGNTLLTNVLVSF